MNEALIYSVPTPSSIRRSKNFAGQMWAAVPDDFGQKEAKYLTHRITPLPSIKFLHRIAFHTASCTPDDYLQWGLSEDIGCINSLNS